MDQGALAQVQQREMGEVRYRKREARPHERYRLELAVLEQQVHLHRSRHRNCRRASMKLSETCLKVAAILELRDNL